MTEPQYQVVSPEGRWVGTPMRSPAPATAARARRVGFVWDHVFRGDEMFRMAEAHLHAAEPDLTFVGHDAFGDLHGHDEAGVVARLPDLLRAEEIDSVIVGVGA